MEHHRFRQVDVIKWIADGNSQTERQVHVALRILVPVFGFFAALAVATRA